MLCFLSKGRARSWSAFGFEREDRRDHLDLLEGGLLESWIVMGCGEVGQAYHRLDLSGHRPLFLGSCSVHMDSMMRPY